jgi:dienelactone hydrolase
LPGIELVRLSPSGERIALAGAVGDARRVLLMTRDHTLLRALTVGETKVRNLSWVGEDHVLITMSSTVDAWLEFGHSYELTGVVHVGLSGTPWSVFQQSRDVAHFVQGYFGAASVGGHWSGFFGGITEARASDNSFYLNHGYRDLYRVDLDTGNAKLEAKGSESDHDWVLSPDGAVLAHSEYQKRTGEWRLYAGAHDDKILLKKTSPTRDIYLAGQGRTSGTVVVRDVTGDGDRIEEVSIADGRSEVLFAGAPVTLFLHDRVTGLLLGASIEKYPGAVFFDHSLQDRYNAAVYAFPHDVVHVESYGENLERLVVETQGPRDSGTYWLIDMKTDQAEPLGSPYPDIQGGDVGETREVKYPAADGLVIDAILTLPPGRPPKSLPLVVLPHGGPLGIRDRLGFDWWAQAFASRGYAVLQPNFRGSGGRGVEFMRAGFGEFGKKMLTDISDGVADLARQGVIDPGRVCIAGGSYGGYAALAGVTLQHGLYRCAVSVSGPSQLSTFDAWQSSYYGGRDTAVIRSWQRMTGSDSGGDASLRAISPALFAAQADAPILLIHGKDDTRVPMEQSETMAAALKHAHKPYEFVTLEHEDHFLSREVTRTAMLKAAVAFVEKYDPPQ